MTSVVGPLDVIPAGIVLAPVDIFFCDFYGHWSFVPAGTFSLISKFYTETVMQWHQYLTSRWPLPIHVLWNIWQFFPTKFIFTSASSLKFHMSQRARNYRGTWCNIGTRIIKRNHLWLVIKQHWYMYIEFKPLSMCWE